MINTVKMICLIIFVFLSGSLAGMIYLVGFYFFYRVYISVCIAHWKEQHKLITQSESNLHVFLGYGGPVLERISSLENISTASEHELESIYIKILRTKLFLILACIAITIYTDYVLWANVSAQIHQLPLTTWLTCITTLVIYLFLIIKLVEVLNQFNMVSHRKWYIHQYIEDGKSYYSAYKTVHSSGDREYYSFLLYVM